MRSIHIGNNNIMMIVITSSSKNESFCITYIESELVKNDHEAYEIAKIITKPNDTYSISTKTNIGNV